MLDSTRQYCNVLSDVTYRSYAVYHFCQEHCVPALICSSLDFFVSKTVKSCRWIFVNIWQEVSLASRSCGLDVWVICAYCCENIKLVCTATRYILPPGCYVCSVLGCAKRQQQQADLHWDKCVLRHRWILSEVQMLCTQTLFSWFFCRMKSNFVRMTEFLSGLHWWSAF